MQFDNLKWDFFYSIKTIKLIFNSDHLDEFSLFKTNKKPQPATSKRLQTKALSRMHRHGHKLFVWQI